MVFTLHICRPPLPPPSYLTIGIVTLAALDFSDGTLLRIEASPFSQGPHDDYERGAIMAILIF